MIHSLASITNSLENGAKHTSIHRVGPTAQERQREKRRKKKRRNKGTREQETEKERRRKEK
jgi:hypothetical protein